MADYGLLGSIVSGAGTMMSAAFAIGFSFKGRAKWEPAEEDLPKGAQRVAGMLTSVAMVVLWFRFRFPEFADIDITIAIYAALAALFFLIVYGLFISVLTFHKEVGAKKPAIKIIGGFMLTEEARKQKKERNKTIQELIIGSAYDVDKIWPRLSRAFAKATFQLCYIGLVASGCVALTCGALLLGMKMN